MGIGASLFLLALGGILKFAVTADADGFDINTIGVILMIVGGLGLILTLLFWSDSAPLSRRRETVVREDRDVI